MPEVYFDIKWPDGRITRNYSPSSAVTAYFAPGESFEIADFLRRAREAMAHASARVQQVHGFPCARAGATLADIEATSRAFTDTQDGRVTILELYE